MQTFLPLPTYCGSAYVLDRQRLGKQRVEVKQLALALGVRVGDHSPKPSSWANHPAARMWEGYEGALLLYGIAICDEWTSRGYRDSLAPQFWRAMKGRDISPPPWLGRSEFHASHRSNLLRKLPEHYRQFEWSEPDNLPYVWPVGTAVAV